MSERMGIGPLGLLFVVAVLLCSPASRAQDNSDEVKGVDSGGYNVQQSIEVGYRGEWVNGNQDTYDTFVNLHDGPRLLDYTLNMRSLNNQGLLFDNLNFSNFGYGGDPEDVSRLRIQKNKWYDFSLLFRRDENFWDYNLLANPLNPFPINGSTNPAFAVTQSPHSLNLVRRMQDYDLTLLPQSRVRFRLGYSRDVNEGPSFNSFHGTTDFLLAQNFRMTTNAYHVGVDFRVLPKTTISYDQFLEWDKNDTNDSLANTPFVVQSTQFPGTVPVDLGLNWYYPPTATTTPCAAPFTGIYPNYASPTCKEYQSFVMTGPTRNFMPTERVSFQSTFFDKLEMSGSASYSSSNNTVSNFYSANEWTASATNQIRDAMVAGPAVATQVAVHADWSAIYSLTEKVRILDSINYDNWRNPGAFSQIATNLFATAPQVTGQSGILLPIANFAPLAPVGLSFTDICPSPYTAITCPQHSATSSADLATTSYAQFLGQKLVSNTIQLETDFTQRISGRIGYRYDKRTIGELAASAPVGSVYYPGGVGGTPANAYLAGRGSCKSTSTTAYVAPAGCVLNADGSITYTAPPPTGSTARAISTINENVGLAGLTLRPMDTLRITADFEFGYNDYAYTRIWPRQIQSYKVHVNYKPRTWATVDGAVDIHENRDNVSDVGNLEHGRTYSLFTVLAPNPKFAYTLGYNYTDIYLQTFICFRDTFGTMTGPSLPVFPACPITNSPSSVPLGTMGFYADKQHYAYSDVMWKPMKRVTTSLGYSATFAGGNTVFLNPLQPAGTLAFNYQTPFASVQLDVYRGLSWKAMWNYYGYNAKAPFNPNVPVTVGGSGATLALLPLGAPDFNGSTATFSVRYAF